MKLTDLFADVTNLTRDQTIPILWELIFFHRSSAHCLAGLIPQVADIEVKLKLAAQLKADMEQAIQLKKRVDVLRTFEEQLTDQVASGFFAVLAHLEQIEDPLSRANAVTQMLKPAMIGVCDTYLEGADPWLDARGVTLIKRSRSLLQKFAEAGPGDPLFNDLWQNRHTGEQKTLGPDSWSVSEPCPGPARPQGFTFAAKGSLRPLYRDMLFDKKDIGSYLHSLMDHNLLTLELMARTLHEAPQMPWEFHLDLAAQISNRVRQFRMSQRVLPDYGLSYGDELCDRSAYEAYYRFEPCEPGSEKELLWRLLIKIVYYQANELGPFHTETYRRALLGQLPLSNLFASFTCDAVGHVRDGLKWARHLCGKDARAAFEELKLVQAYVDQAARARRAAYKKDHPETALAEEQKANQVHQCMMQKPADERALYQRRFSRKLRAKAGFLEQEIDWAAQMQGIDVTQQEVEHD